MSKFLSIACVFFCVFTWQYAVGQQVNYEESRVPDYTLPGLYETSAGIQVETVKAWNFLRRPEIIHLFEKNVYGQVPAHFDAIEFDVINENQGAMNGAAHLKEVDITVTRYGKSVTIRLNLFLPKNISGPVPVFLLINHRGPENMDPTRTVKKDFWPAEKIISRGYAAGAYNVEDVADDDAKTFKKDAIGTLYPEQLQQTDGMQALSAWAWGAMRMMDYFVRDPDIDQNRAVIIGHSRGGKAALWTGAVDQRWSIVISNESGAGGAALSRRRFGETVQQINGSFPHWFAPNFERYNENESELPVDQHMLIASIAPRPVYVASAREDKWADPKGEYLSLYHGSEVYKKIFRLPVTLPEKMPEVNAPVIDSYAGYHVREGSHDLSLFDWEQFMNFADYHFQKQNRKGR